MEEFKTYLDDNASEEERQAAELIGEGLTAIRLQEKVQQAAAERNRWQKIKFWSLGGLIMLLLSSSLYWLSSDSPNTIEEVPAIETPTPLEDTLKPLDPPKIETTPEEPIIPPEEPRQESPPPKAPSPPPDLPIAQATPEPVLPPPPYGAPDTYLRGQSTAENDKTLLNQLWYTDYPLTGLATNETLESVNNFLQERNFPLAFVGIQRLTRKATDAPSDTLIYLQAYTLLEMGQGQEANVLLNQLNESPEAWQAQINWYRGLAHLLADQKEEALLIFQEIAQEADHPYYLQAQKAVELYSQ